MQNKALVDYIKEKIGLGYNMEVIRSALLKWGCPPNTITDSINYLNNIKIKNYEKNNLKINKQPSKPTLLTNIFELFFKPNKFFAEIELERSFSFFLKIFILSFSIQLFLTLIINLFLKRELRVITALLLTNITTLLLSALTTLFILFIIILFIYLIHKCILKIFPNFKKLFFIGLYSLTPLVVINSLSFLSFYPKMLLFNIAIGFFSINLIFVWSLLLLAIGISKLENISLNTSLIVVFAPTLVLVVAFIILLFDAITVSGIFL